MTQTVAVIDYGMGNLHLLKAHCERQAQAMLWSQQMPRQFWRQIASCFPGLVPFVTVLLSFADWVAKQRFV